MYLRSVLLPSAAGTSWSLHSKKRSKTLFFYVDTAAAGSLDRLHTWANSVELLCVSKDPTRLQPWKQNREVSAATRPCLEPDFLTCLLADRCHCLAPVDRKVAGHKTWAIFYCAESRRWHGAADGYREVSGLKPGLTCMRQKVCTTHELPEKEPGDMVGLSEVENNCWAPDRDHFLLLLCALWKVAVVSSFAVGISDTGIISSMSCSLKVAG